MANEKSENDVQGYQGKTFAELNNESKYFQKDVHSGTNFTFADAQMSEETRGKTAQDSIARVYSTVEAASPYKFQGTTRIIKKHADSECAQCPFKLSTAPLSPMKPVTIVYKKPRLDSPTDSDVTSTQDFTQETNYIDAYQVNANSQAESINISCESVLLSDDECSSQMFQEQSGKEINQDFEASEQTNYDQQPCRHEELEPNHANPHFSKELKNTNVSTKSNSEQNKTVKIKVVPPTIKKDLNQNEEREGFIKALVNVVHSCIGKRATSTSNINSENIIVPAYEQLEPAKTKSLIKLLETSSDGVDMKLSLFMAACSHNPRNLQPFPQKVLDDNEINRHLLYYIAEEVPSVNMILFLLKEKEALVSLRKELLPIVDWLVRVEDPRLELLKEQESKELIKRHSIPSELTPTKIFRILTKRNNESEEFWQGVKGDSETILAYHSCRVDQAHEILYYGLNNRMHKNGALGQGVYLTSNLSFCLENCQPGHTWGKSSMATKVKLVFITELISNHSVLSYNGHGAPFYGNKATGINTSKYYFIKKPNLVRLRYLLVYVLEPSVLPMNPFSYVPIRKKLIKYLGIFRISLLIATILLGATASQRKSQSSSWFLETIQNCYQKMSTDLTQWPVWQYVETPYISVPAADKIPQTSPNYF